MLSSTCGLGNHARAASRSALSSHSSHAARGTLRLPTAPPLRAIAARVERLRTLEVSNLFTGIVQGTAEVVSVEKKEDFSSIKVAFPAGSTQAITLGASVAINGTCLTVTEIESESDTLSFDIIVETLRATNLGCLEPGSSVNFERSARMGDEIGGHHVSGHVACTATVTSVEETDNNQRWVFKLSKPELIKYILAKGFVAVDGCSLTVGEVTEDNFSVYLIPETLRVTVFGRKATGDAVNIEIEAQTQAIVDTVERVVAQYMVKR